MWAVFLHQETALYIGAHIHKGIEIWATCLDMLKIWVALAPFLCEHMNRVTNNTISPTAEPWFWGEPCDALMVVYFSEIPKSTLNGVGTTFNQWNYSHLYHKIILRDQHTKKHVHQITYKVIYTKPLSCAIARKGFCLWALYDFVVTILIE